MITASHQPVDAPRLPPMYWTVWAVTMVLFAGKFVIPVFSIHLVVDRGVEPALAGVVLGAFGLGGTVSTLVGGILSDRFGRIPTSVTSLALSCAFFLTLGFEHSLPVLALLLFGYGIASFATIPVLMAMIADIVPPALRQRAYALQSWSMNIGFAIGPAVAVWLSSVAFGAPFVALAVITLACTIAFWALARRWSTAAITGPAGGDSPARGAWTTLARDRLLLAFVVGFLGYAGMYTQFGASAPLVMREHGFGALEFGALLSLNGLVLVLLQLPTLRIVERFPKMRLLIVSFLVTAVGYAGYIVSDQLWHYVAATLIWSLAELFSYPVAAAIVSDLAPRRHRGAYQGMYSLVIAVAQAISPALGGLALHLAGPTGLWAACVVVLLASAAILLAIRRRVEARSVSPSGS